MALIGNYSVLNKNPGRALGGSTVSDSRAAWNKSGANRNRYLGSGMSRKDGSPFGHRPPYSWLIAQVDGGMSSVNTVSGSGGISYANLAGGLNAEATLEGFGQIDPSSAAQLVVSAVATLSGVGGLSADIVGKLEASATLAGSGDISGSLGALADAVATIGGTSSLSGDLRGVGHMTADILPYTDLSPQALAAAVWGALAAQFNSSGTMGEKLNASGSSGDPWTADLSGYNTDGTAGKRMKETLTKIQFLALK